MTWCNMVWELKTPPVPNKVQEPQTDCSDMDKAFDLLKCNEDLPTSPGCPSSEGQIEYGKHKQHLSVRLHICKVVYG